MCRANDSGRLSSDSSRLGDGYWRRCFPIFGTFNHAKVHSTQRCVSAICPSIHDREFAIAVQRTVRGDVERRVPTVRMDGGSDVK